MSGEVATFPSDPPGRLTWGKENGGNDDGNEWIFRRLTEAATALNLTWIGAAARGAWDAAGEMARGVRMAVKCEIDSPYNPGKVKVSVGSALSMATDNAKLSYNRHFEAIRNPEGFKQWNALVDQFAGAKGCDGK